jgi:IS4 transposase
MLHYSLDLFTLSMREMLVTDHRETGEKLANFKNLGKEDIVMADRAYGNMPGLRHLKRLGADYVLRIQSRGVGNRLYTDKQQKIDLMERLSSLKEGKIADIKAMIEIDGVYGPIRICAMRKGAGSERAGLKRLAKSSQRKKGGKAVTKEQQENNKYIIIATSLGKEASAARVLELYRARWQIGTAFKRLKSLFGYNDLPAENSESAKAWFYGKLLLAALCETLVNTGRFSPSGR